MKLLFDHNVSPSLIDRLQDLFPDSEHVFNITLHRAGDVNVWTYARDNGFVLVSKDVDFLEMSLLRGFPPKLLWLRIGNCTTGDIESLFRSNHATIVEFGRDEARGICGILRSRTERTPWNCPAISGIKRVLHSRATPAWPDSHGRTPTAKDSRECIFESARGLDRFERRGREISVARPPLQDTLCASLRASLRWDDEPRRRDAQSASCTLFGASVDPSVVPGIGRSGPGERLPAQRRPWNQTNLDSTDDVRMPRMRISSGRVVHGQIVYEGELPEGAEVTLLARDDEETFEVSAELRAVLLESIAQCDRGEAISAEEFIREMRSRE